MTSYAHAEHEARHVCACWYFEGLSPNYLRVGAQATTEGVMQVSRTGPLTTASLIVSLVGWINDPDLPPGAQWPEPWEPRLDAPDQVGVITRKLQLTQSQYERCCELAQELVADPDFQEAVRLVARAAMIAPLIDAAGLEILREAAGVPELEGVFA